MQTSAELRAPQSGSVLNHLYESREQKYNEFIKEISNYTTRVVRKISATNNWSAGFDAIEDITQDVLIKVLEKLDQFRGESKFSSWLYTVVQNATLDIVRQNARNQEVELLAYKDYAAESYGNGATRSSKKPTSDEQGGTATFVSPLYGVQASREEHSGAAIDGIPLFQPAYYEMNQRERHLDMEIKRILGGMSARDRQIFNLIVDGRKPAEVAKQFGADIRQINNAYSRVRDYIRAELTLVTVHECEVKPADGMIKGTSYVTTAGKFCSLGHCHCKRRIPEREADQLLKEHRASSIFVVYDKSLHFHRFGGKKHDQGEIVTNPTEIWISNSPVEPVLDVKGTKPTIHSDVSSNYDVPSVLVMKGTNSSCFQTVA